MQSRLTVRVSSSVRRCPHWTSLYQRDITTSKCMRIMPRERWWDVDCITRLLLHPVTDQSLLTHSCSTHATSIVNSSSSSTINFISILKFCRATLLQVRHVAAICACPSFRLFFTLITSFKKLNHIINTINTLCLLFYHIAYANIFIKISVVSMCAILTVLFSVCLEYVNVKIM